MGTRSILSPPGEELEAAGSLITAHSLLRLATWVMPQLVAGELSYYLQEAELLWHFCSTPPGPLTSELRSPGDLRWSPESTGNSSEPSTPDLSSEQLVPQLSEQPGAAIHRLQDSDSPEVAAMQAVGSRAGLSHLSQVWLHRVPCWSLSWPHTFKNQLALPSGRYNHSGASPAMLNRLFCLFFYPLHGPLTASSCKQRDIFQGCGDICLRAQGGEAWCSSGKE